MDARTVVFTAPANRGSSRLYQDLAEYLALVSNFSDSDISDLIMDTYQKVCSHALLEHSPITSSNNMWT